MAEDDQVVVDVKALLYSMNKKLEDYFYESELTGLRFINRVTPSVRNDNKSDYDPKLISIGPYHRKAEAVQATKPLKWSYLQDLIARSGENSLEQYINAVLPLEELIREYYSEEIDLEPYALVQMMVVDGCFIVEFLIKYCLNEKDDRICTAVNWNLPVLRNDLLLLENQIPFFVLQELFRVSTIPQLEKGVTLLELAATYIAPEQLETLLKRRPTPGTKQEASSPPPPEETPPQLPFPHHLLHLYHASFEPTPGYDEPAAAYSWFASIFIWPVKMAMITPCVLGLLSLIPFQLRPDDDDDEGGWRAPRTIWSASELDDAGVKFCRKKTSGSILEVTFSGCIMEMPKLRIHETTASLFRNLLAFEQCYPTVGNHFTSYAVLMNNLIRMPSDVAVLRERGIIESRISRDDEVADLFFRLCKLSLYVKYDKHHLVRVFKNVTKYSQQKRHRWRAQITRDYFSSPWVASFIAFIILLAVAMVQTFYTIYPYYHPR